MSCLPRAYIIRVREIHFSLTGHFVRRTSSPSPDILNYHRTYVYKMSGELFPGDPFTGHSLIYSLRKLCPVRSNPFAGHLSNFARHVRRVRRISRTLYISFLKPHLLVDLSRIGIGDFGLESDLEWNQEVFAGIGIGIKGAQESCITGINQS